MYLISNLNKLKPNIKRATNIKRVNSAPIKADIKAILFLELKLEKLIQITHKDSDLFKPSCQTLKLKNTRQLQVQLQCNTQFLSKVTKIKIFYRRPT